MKIAATVLMIGLAGLTAVPVAAQGRGRGRDAGIVQYDIPPGHLPPPGLCRVWYDGRPPGQQPRPTNCREAERAAARSRYARVIYGYSAWQDRDGRNDRYASRDEYWDAARYYRQDNRRYVPRRLSRNDRIYRGSDNRYYCRRDDGTSGLIIGGISGGLLGSIIAPRGSKVLGTIIGAGAGAAIGKAVDDGDVVCR